MTSKIAKIVEGKPWLTKNGEQMYAYKVLLTDGTEGQANAKSNPPAWKVGDTVDYQSQQGQYGPKLTIKKLDAQQAGQAGHGAQQGKPSFNEDGARIGCSMRCAAVVLAGTDINAPGFRKDLWTVATAFYRCAKALEDGKFAPSGQQEHKVADNAPVSEGEDQEDSPF